MFWGVLIGFLVAAVFGYSMLFDVEAGFLADTYKEMATGIGIGVATGTVIFLLGAGVVSAMDYMRKRKTS
jgi:hypothetical protein|tara:strand:- start:538 stop:747 length:210 start_codon:yes stop_codon:yes gene_type:complete